MATAKGVWLSESKERRVKVHLWVVGLSAANIGNHSGCNGSGPSCGNVKLTSHTFLPNISQYECRLDRRAVTDRW